jgi:hypothetical protein
MLLKICHMTPWCPKQFSCDEYTGESQLPGLFDSVIRAVLQQKKLLVPNTVGSPDSTMYVIITGVS